MRASISKKKKHSKKHFLYLYYQDLFILKHSLSQKYLYYLIVFHEFKSKFTIKLTF